MEEIEIRSTRNDVGNVFLSTLDFVVLLRIMVSNRFQKIACIKDFRSYFISVKYFRDVEREKMVSLLGSKTLYEMIYEVLSVGEGTESVESLKEALAILRDNYRDMKDAHINECEQYRDKILVLKKTIALLMDSE